MKPKKYTLKTVEDFLQIPDDRLDECLREFAIALRYVRAVEAKARDADAKAKIHMPYFGWIDDGKSDVYLVVTEDRE